MRSIFLSIANIRGIQLNEKNDSPLTIDDISLIVGYDYECECYFFKITNLIVNNKIGERHTEIEQNDFRRIQSILIKRLPLSYECYEQGYDDWSLITTFEKDNVISFTYIDDNEIIDKIRLELSEEQYNELLDKFNILETNIPNN